MSLDGLTDLISNAVGLGILFLMIALLRIQDQTPSIHLEVDPEYAARAAPAFFLIQGSRVMALDNAKLFTRARQALARSADTTPIPFNVDHYGVQGVLEDQGILLRITDTRNWPVMSVGSQITTGPLSIALEQLSRQKQFAFVFVWSDVQANGFQTFRQFRAQLQDRGIPVGWRPISAEHPPVLCVDDNIQRCNYRPSTPRQPQENPS